MTLILKPHEEELLRQCAQDLRSVDVEKAKTIQVVLDGAEAKSSDTAPDLHSDPEKPSQHDEEVQGG